MKAFQSHNNTTVFILFCALCAWAVVSIFSHSGTCFIFSLFFMLMVVLYAKWPSDEKKFLVMVLVWAFLIRVVLMYILHWQSYREGFGGFISGDDRLYSLKALEIAFIWQRLPHNSIADMVGAANYGLNLYTYLLALFYRFIETSYFSSKLINCFIGAVTPMLIFLIAKKIFSINVANAALVLTSFYPSIVRWSICNLKDPLTILVSAVIFYLACDIGKGFERMVKIIVMIICVILLKKLQSVNFYALAITAAIFAVYILFTFIWNKKGVVIGLFVLLVAYGVLGYTVAKPKLIPGLNYVVHWNSMRCMSDTAGYKIYDDRLIAEIKSGRFDILSLGRTYVRGLGYFIFSPFPWKISTPNQIMAYPQVVLWYVLVLFSIFGFYRGFSAARWQTVLLLSFIVVGSSLFAMGEANIGAAFRHRDYFSPFVFIYASAGIMYCIDKFRGQL